MGKLSSNFCDYARFLSPWAALSAQVPIAASPKGATRTDGWEFGGTPGPDSLK